MRRKKLEGIIASKKRLDVECERVVYEPQQIKKLCTKTGKARNIEAPTNGRREATMMVDSYDVMRMREAASPPEPSSLRTGEGHGHFREFDRERSKKDARARKRKRAKMSKASRKRNRRQ